MPAPTTTRSERRRFGLTVGLALATLALVGAWRGRAGAAAACAALGAALVVAGLAWPDHLGGVQRGWMALAHAMSRVTTPVLMTLVYVGAMTPIGLAMRLAGRRPIGPRRAGGTFLVRRPPGARRSDLHRQF